MNNLTPLPISTRQELLNFQPYKPGRSIEQIKRQYGLKKVIKLASNENSYGPSALAVKAYKQAVKRIFRYPDSPSVDLRATVAEVNKLDVGEVIIGAGSDEIIELLAKTFLTPQDNIVVSAHAFMQYQLAAQLMGAGVITVPMKNMRHDLLGMAKAANSRTKLVFVANPNNPTGTHNTDAEIKEFLTALPRAVLPVFDEAYFEYAQHNSDYPSMIRDFFRDRPMVVLRTFSKIYGLAGLRVGYGAAPESCVAQLDKIRPPFNVSIPAQSAALAALGDAKHVKKSAMSNLKEMEFVQSELTKIGLQVIPSSGNFILFTGFSIEGHSLFDRLIHKGIIARSVDEYGLPEYLRITIGTHDENKEFLKALQEVLEKT